MAEKLPTLDDLNGASTSTALPTLDELNGGATAAPAPPSQTETTQLLDVPVIPLPPSESDLQEK